MSGAENVIASGREAWQRIRREGRKSFDDWIAVARALAAGRTEALKIAGTNQCLGSKYNAAMGQWLRSNGLDGINNQERYRALLVLENLPAIEAWRDGLSDAKQRSFNHPNSIWSQWKASCGEKRPSKRQQGIIQGVTAAADNARKGKAVHWPSDHLKRAHLAMRDSRSSDFLVLARVALQAAIRNEADLLALLSPEPPTISTPLRSNPLPAHAA